jgi:Phosphotransferase enzyme family
MLPSRCRGAVAAVCKDRSVTISGDPDGSSLLTSAEVKDLLSAAVEHAGGSLISWRLDHIDANPRRSTTATYSAAVDWPTGRRTELLGASARAGGRSGNDERAVIFADGEREVAVWLYPNDPDLPGLPRAAVPNALAALFNEHRILDHPLAGENIALEMISYRPRRRAVLKAVIRTHNGPTTFFVKVLREAAYGPTLERHELLRRARFPAALVAAATADFILVLHQLSGRPLTQAIFDEAMPCTAENMIILLDSLPSAVVALPRRPPWTGAVATYAEMIGAALPVLDPQLRWLVDQVSGGLTGMEPGREPTHGDFHEGQLFVSKGLITGLLDIDTMGPGRRADDLACMIAHLSTMQRMTAEQAAGLTRLINLWLQVFDTRVDPAELRLRAAGVIVSLATGPYRGQEPNWQAETVRMIESAVGLVQSSVQV